MDMGWPEDLEALNVEEAGNDLKSKWQKLSEAWDAGE